MRPLLPALYSLTLMTVCMPLMAQEPEEERPYEGSVALGYVGTTGNTEVTTLNTELLLTYHTDDWTHNFELETLTSREDGVGKAERYYIADKSDYRLLVQDRYLYVQGSYTDDRFSGFNYQAIVSGGLGQYFIENEAHNLEGFVGLGYRQNDTDIDGVQGEVVITLGEDYNWQISDTSQLSQGVTFEIGDKRTITTFNIALESEILGQLSTRIAFRLRNNSDVPVGNDKTDTLTSVSLAYSF